MSDGVRCHVPDPEIRLRQQVPQVVSVSASAWGSSEPWRSGRTWGGFLGAIYEPWASGDQWASGDTWGGASAAATSGNLRGSVRVTVRA